MHNQLPNMEQPDWLSRIDPETIQEQFPYQDVLRDSLYYPAAGHDGGPIAHLAGNFLSFVYVDYCVGRDDLLNELRIRGFSGYAIAAQRTINVQDVDRGVPNFPLPQQGTSAARYREYLKNPFCEWIIFQRKDGFSEDHGPRRFSFLYLCAEGIAAFQSLYVANGICPAAVAVVQPGTGFGLNWTNFTDPQGPLAAAVLNNPAGRPTFLLFGGIGGRQFYEQSCWPEYTESLGFAGGGGSENEVGVWRRPG